MRIFRDLLVAALFVAQLHALPAQAQTTSRGVAIPPSITAEDIAVLKTWKVNLVRYNLVRDQNADSLDLTEYSAWVPEALSALDDLLPLFAAANIKVVINLYSPPGGFARKSGKPLHNLFVHASTQSAFVDTWRTIATHYKDNSTVHGYDILNEPAQASVESGLKSWSELAQETADAIRLIDTTHPIIVESVYGAVGTLRKLTPLTTSNIVYSIHAYSNLTFMHQGIYGKKLGVKYPKGRFNKASLQAYLRNPLKFAKKHNAKIYVGEFSAVRWAPGKSSYFYLRDQIKLFEKYGWDWTYHAFREADAWSVEHDGDINNKEPTNKQTDRERLLRQYFAKN